MAVSQSCIDYVSTVLLRIRREVFLEWGVGKGLEEAVMGCLKTRSKYT
jgi:hypothetical protein